MRLKFGKPGGDDELEDPDRTYKDDEEVEPAAKRTGRGRGRGKGPKGRGRGRSRGNSVKQSDENKDAKAESRIASDEDLEKMRKGAEERVRQDMLARALEKHQGGGENEVEGGDGAKTGEETKTPKKRRATAKKKSKKTPKTKKKATPKKKTPQAPAPEKKNTAEMTPRTRKKKSCQDPLRAACVIK